VLFSLLPRRLFVCKSYQSSCSFDILTHVFSDRLRNTSVFSLFSVVIEAEFFLRSVEFSQIRRTFVQHWPFGLCTASFRDYRFVPDRSLYNIAVLLAFFVNRLRDFTLERASKTLCFAEKTRVAFCRRFETVVILRVRACLSSLQPRSRSGVRKNDTIGIHSRWPARHHP
jgi:hypothetical protein